jgi:hypothetical protein
MLSTLAIGTYLAHFETVLFDEHIQHVTLTLSHYVCERGRADINIVGVLLGSQFAILVVRNALHVTRI